MICEFRQGLAGNQPCHGKEVPLVGKGPLPIKALPRFGTPEL